MAAPDSTTPSLPSWLAPQGPREGLGHYVEVVREHARLIVLCVVAGALAAGLYAKLASPSWTATSQLLVSPVSSEANLMGLGLITESGNPAGDTSTAATLVTTPEVAAVAAKELGAHESGRAILDEVTAVPLADSNIVSVTATASSAERAQELADAFAEGTVNYETQQLHKQLEAIIPALEAQLRLLPAAERTGPGSLSERLTTLRAMQASPNPTFRVASLAQRPLSPSWPRTKLSVIVGALVGAVIGFAIAFLQEGLDPRIRREETLGRIFRLPILARIPRERSVSPKAAPLRPDQLSSVSLESYRMLRVALAARDGGERWGGAAGRSVMVTGSTSSEGKSTVALNLAWALASGGRSVILIEADLRRPSLGRSLGVAADRGISGVLLHEMSFDDALVTVDGTDGRLRVLFTDRTGTLLADGLLAAAGDLISSAKELADYVIVDAPPVTEVSDALPLSEHVDDVLIVARIGRSRTDRLTNLGEILGRHRVQPAGIVVVGDHSKADSGYYAEETKQRNRLRRRSRGRLAAVSDR